MYFDSAMFEPLLEILSGARTEIVIFVIAACIHILVFGTHRVKNEKKRARVLEQGQGSQQDSGARTHQCREGASPLVRMIRASLRDVPTAEDLAHDIEEELQKRRKDDTVQALVGSLESLGKSVTPTVLRAVHQVRARLALERSQRLSELLLRGYFNLDLVAFKQLLAEVEEAGNATPSILVMALKAAVKSSDFEAAVSALKKLTVSMQGGTTTTASAAPQQLLQQTIILAMEKDAMPMLIQELRACGLFTSWTTESLIRECFKAGDSKNLQEIEHLAREQGVEFTASTYATLIHGSNTPCAAAALLDEALGRGLEPTTMLVVAADMAMAQGNATLANIVLDRFQEHPSPSVAAVLVCLTGEGILGGKETDAAVLELYEKHLEGSSVLSELRSQGVRILVEAAIRNKRLDILQQVLVAVGGSFRPAVILKNLGAEKRLEDAFTIFKACPEKTSVLYNSIMDVCIDCKDLRAAEKVMADAVAAKLADVVTYNTIIKMHVQIGDLRRARAGIEQMREVGLAPNHVTFNELIDAQVKVSYDGAWTLIEEMKACGLEPNQVTCSILLKTIQPNTRGVDVRQTLAIVTSLENEMDEVLLSSFCEACVRIKRADILRKQLRYQRSERCVQVFGAYTYGSVIRAYGFLKDLRGVWDTWNEMRGRGILPTSTTLGCMTEAVVNNDGPEAGYSLICEVLGNPQLKELVNAIIYCSVLKGFCHQRRFDRVWAVYKEMLRLKIKFSLVTYNTLIDACARCREVDRIPAILREMAQQDIHPNVITYSTIMKGHCQENRLDKAFELLEKMKRNPACQPDDFTYNTLLDGCACQGLLDKGVQVLEDMQKRGVHPSNFTLSLTAKLGNRSNRVDMAFHLCEDLATKYNLFWNIHVYNNLLHACTNHKKTWRAFEVLAQMLNHNIRPDTRTYTLIIGGLLSDGDANEVVALVRAAYGLPTASPRLARLNPDMLALRGGLPEDLLAEALTQIASLCGDEKMVLLLRDLRRVPGFRIDPKLPLRLTSQAIQTP